MQVGKKEFYLWCHLLRQQNTHANSFEKTSFFMVTAKFTHRVYDFIHIPERHLVHLLVELIEVSSDLFVIVGIVFVIAFVEHG